MHPVEAFVQLARREHIDTVIAAGELLWHEGRCPKVDEEGLERELAAVARALPNEAFGAFSQTLRDLHPYLARHYEDWPAVEALDPFYVVNSR